MARITVEDCIDKFPSRFELVLVASNRARKLHSGDEPTVEKDNDKNTVIALREIAEETISIEDMKTSLIEEYQTISFSEEEDQESYLEGNEEENLEVNEEENLDDENDKENYDKTDSEIKSLISDEEQEIENLNENETPPSESEILK